MKESSSHRPSMIELKKCKSIKKQSFPIRHIFLVLSIKPTFLLQPFGSCFMLLPCLPSCYLTPPLSARCHHDLVVVVRRRQKKYYVTVVRKLFSLTDTFNMQRPDLSDPLVLVPVLAISSVYSGLSPRKVNRRTSAFRMSINEFIQGVDEDLGM